MSTRDGKPRKGIKAKGTERAGGTAKTATAAFFSAALREAMSQRHFNQAQLAEYLHVDPAYISRWLKGSSPRLDQMCSVLDQLGWDLRRAHPEYSPFRDAVTRMAETAGGEVAAEEPMAYGNVDEMKKLLEKADEQRKRQAFHPIDQVGAVDSTGGEVSLFDAPEGEAIEAASTLFPELPFADNEVGMLKVEGNRLAPEYPSGTSIFIRRVLKATDVPTGSLVIMRSPDDDRRLELRKLVRLEEPRGERIDRVLGAPIRFDQDYLVQKPRESRLEYVVVGVLKTPA